MCIPMQCCMNVLVQLSAVASPQSGPAGPSRHNTHSHLINCHINAQSTDHHPPSLEHTTGHQELYINQDNRGSSWNRTQYFPLQARIIQKLFSDLTLINFYNEGFEGLREICTPLHVPPALSAAT